MQYIHSLSHDGEKYVLWRVGEYQYQIQHRDWLSKILLMEYYDALDFFNEFMDSRRGKKELI